MLRVLLVIPSFEGGGAERAWATLLQAFPESRLSCLVARFRGGGVFERLLPPRLPTYLVPGRRGDPTVVLRLARLIRSAKPDIVLAVLRYANVVAILASLLAGRRTRLVINEQNIPEVEFAQRRGAPFKRRVLRALYPRAHGVTAISRGIAEALVATAIGLFAAIPAVVAYNRYSHDVERLANRFESFMEEFSNILHRQAVK